MFARAYGPLAGCGELYREFGIKDLIACLIELVERAGFAPAPGKLRSRLRSGLCLNEKMPRARLATASSICASGLDSSDHCCRGRA